MHKFELECIEREAKRRIDAEKFEQAVSAAMQRRQARKWWHKLVPVISITWRK